MVEFVAERFALLEDRVNETLDGIADALSGGNLEVATDILWATLRIAWLQGTSFLTKVWQDATGGMVDFARLEWDNLVIALNLVWIGLSNAFTAVTDGMAMVWARLMANLKKPGRALTEFFTKVFNSINGLFNESFDVDAANAVAKDIFAEEELQIDIVVSELGDRQAQAAADKRVEDAKNLDALVEGLAIERARKDAIRDKKASNARKAAAEELARLNALRDESLSKAKDIRVESDSRKELDKIRARDVGVSATSAAGGTSRGTFNAAALQSLESGGGESEVAKSGKKTVDAIKSLSRQVRRNKASFA